MSGTINPALLALPSFDAAYEAIPAPVVQRVDCFAYESTSWGPTLAPDHLERTLEMLKDRMHSPAHSAFSDESYEASLQRTIKAMGTPLPSPLPSRSPSPVLLRSPSPEPAQSQPASLIVTLNVNPNAAKKDKRPYRCNDFEQRRTLEYTFAQLSHACEKRFSRSHDLKRHLKVIASGKLTCDFDACSKTFARNDAKQRHQQVKHGQSQRLRSVHGARIKR